MSSDLKVLWIALTEDVPYSGRLKQSVLAILECTSEWFFALIGYFKSHEKSEEVLQKRYKLKSGRNGAASDFLFLVKEEALERVWFFRKVLN